MKRRLAFLFIIIFAMTCLASCLKAEPEPTKACVFIVGNHANANYIGDMPDNDTYKKAVDMIKSCIEVSMDSSVGSDSSSYDIEADISIIVSDGIPERVDLRQHQMNFYEADVANAKGNENYQKKMQELIDRIISFMFSEELRADDEEVDLLAALSEAQKILARSDANEKHIFIIDTGITTAGYLNMKMEQYNITKTDFRKVYRDLPDDAFPDLTDIEVTFEGLGNVAGMQDDMRSNNAFVNNLVGLWTMLLKERMHAEITDDQIFYAYNEGTPMMYTEDETLYPYVSKVFFKGDMPPVEFDDWVIEPKETEAPETEPPETEPAETEPLVPVEPPVIILPHQALGFEGNKATFREGKEQARYAIQEHRAEIESFLNDELYPDNKLYVVGSIAHTSKNLKTPTDPLAGARAEAVAQLLYDVGVRKDQVVVINAGATDFSWRNTEEFVDGVWRNELAEFNRIVAIIGSTSEAEVAELREKGYID